MDCLTLLKELRRKLKQPSVCRAGCVDCCSRPVLMLYPEWLAIQHPGKYQAGPGHCPFLAENHCAIYYRRPLPCRWHGLAASGENYCADISVKALPAEKVEEIRHRWTLALYRQMGEVLLGRRRGGERLAWYCYCLQIPEGARIMERLREAA
jgi:Fe-S-cluster containining protein